MKKILFLLFIVSIASCAKLPPQTITLTDAIINEGERMHELNIRLLNKMFDEKREKIDAFIKNDYTPKFLAEFNARIPDGTDYKEEFPDMIQSIIPQINDRRDQMQAALESQRLKLVEQLNKDYQTFEKATRELKNLIKSAIKVDEERKEAFQQLNDLTENQIDLNQIETEIDKFILKSGDVGDNINELNNTINSLLKN